MFENSCTRAELRVCIYYGGVYTDKRRIARLYIYQASIDISGRWQHLDCISAMALASGPPSGRCQLNLKKNAICDQNSKIDKEASWPRSQPA